MNSALNVVYPKWYDLFPKKPLVYALPDRLKHRCTTIGIDGPTLRTPSDVKAKTEK